MAGFARLTAGLLAVLVCVSNAAAVAGFRPAVKSLSQVEADAGSGRALCGLSGSASCVPTPSRVLRLVQWIFPPMQVCHEVTD